MSLLKLVDLSYSYGRDAAVRNVSMELRDHKSTVLAGPAGCGKSTLLKIAAGLILYDQGEVLFEGNSIGSKTHKESQAMQIRTGFMFQDAALWANRSLYENLSLPLLIGNPDISAEVIQERVTAGMDYFKIGKNQEVRPSALSAGEKKLISYLRAIIGEPELLFLDEPTSFLDRRNADRLLDHVDSLRDQGVTVLTISHEPMVIERLADYLGIMDDGVLLLLDQFSTIIRSRDVRICQILDSFGEFTAYKGESL